jgi:hypothetical protein
MQARRDGQQVDLRQLACRRSFVFFGMVLALSGCTNMPATDDSFPDWRTMKRRGGLMFSGPAFDRVKRVGRAVLTKPTDGPTWEVGVIEGSSTLVKAFQGNGLLVSTTMIERCENDGQLAAQMVWATYFKMPHGPSSLPNTLVPDAAVVRTADLATLQALAKAGYDPRDALILVQSQTPDGNEPSEARLRDMKVSLRKLGYQV